MIGAIRKWFFGKNLWSFDVILSIIVSVLSFVFIHKYAMSEFSKMILKDGVEIYSAILSTEGCLLGFIITAITIVQALVSTNIFSSLRKSDHYDSFWFAFIWNVRALAFAAFLSFFSLFLSNIETIWEGICLLVVFSSLVVIISVLRSIITLEKILQISRSTLQ